MANAFKSAEKRAQPAKVATKTPETIWTLLDDDPAQGDLARYLEAAAASKAATDAKDAAKGPLLETCYGRWIGHLQSHRVRPGSTMRLAGRAGAVTFVVSEERLEVDDERMAAIRSQVGDRADELVEVDVALSFDAKVLALPTASAAKTGGDQTLYDWLGEKIAGVLARGVKSGEITREQADALIVAKRRSVLKAGWINELAAAGDPEALPEVFAALGGPKRHIQA